MAITLELTVAVLALRETLFGKTSVEVLASAQVISEGSPTVAIYVAGSTIEGSSCSNTKPTGVDDNQQR